jgi:hypothetical protein
VNTSFIVLVYTNRRKRKEKKMLIRNFSFSFHSLQNFFFFFFFFHHPSFQSGFHVSILVRIFSVIEGSDLISFIKNLGFLINGCLGY